MEKELLGQEITYFIVGVGPKYTGGPSETFPISINGITCAPVSDIKSATWFTEDTRAKQLMLLINQVSSIMGIGVAYELRKQTITLEKVE